jgi:hypothetical protein
MMKIETCRFENSFFDDASIIVDCILNFYNDSEYKIKAMIDNDCIDYLFIDIVIAQKVCDSLEISSLKLNKSREVKDYDERRNKNITHVIYSFTIIQNHIESLISMMITKFDQHLIILSKLWMKKHDVNYHDHDDSISFYLDHCNHLNVFNVFIRINLRQKKIISFEKKSFLINQNEDREQRNKDLFEKNQ